MIQKYALNKISSLKIDIDKPSIVFLKWDLWAGKTTLSQKIIKDLGVISDVTSPTYTYYNSYYSESQNIPIYHFDLYRMSDYEEFIHIWGEEILDNNEGIILIEWPQILEKYYTADVEISLKYTEKDNEREVEIIQK